MWHAGYNPVKPPSPLEKSDNNIFLSVDFRCSIIFAVLSQWRASSGEDKNRGRGGKQ